MAYLKVQLCITSAVNPENNPVEMPELYTMQTEIVTTSATSAQSNLVVSARTGPRKARWILTAYGGNMFVVAGDNPTAVDTAADTAFDGDWIQDGQTLSYSVRVEGEKIAVVDSTL